MKATALLQASDTYVLQFEGRNETISISGNGDIAYDMGNHGSTINLFDDGSTSTAWNNPEGSLDKYSFPELQGRISEPSKLDKIERYLCMLYEAQKVDHRVDKEIGEALEHLKKEAGI